MNAFLSIIPFRTFVQNVTPVKNAALTEVSTKGAEENWELFKIEGKILLQTTRVLYMWYIKGDEKHLDYPYKPGKQLVVHI